MTSPAPRRSQPIPVRVSDDVVGDVTEEEARAMMRAVLKLLAKWELSNREKLILLGEPSKRTFHRWSAGAVKALSKDTIYRTGDLLGIHKALRYMFADLEPSYAWIKHPNAVFGGKSALDVMLQGKPSDIGRVRAYLDAERSGW